MSKPIKLYYHDGLYFRRSLFRTLGNLFRHGTLYLPVYNAGDQLSPLLVAHLSGRSVKYAAPFSQNKLIGLGSGLAAIKPGDVVWGAGLARPEHVKYISKGSNFRILAVRGPKTRDALLAAGHDCPEVFGDPTLLAPLVFPRQRKPKFRAGVVPEHPRIGQFRQRKFDDGVTFIPPSLNIEDFVTQLCECDLIITSSLHALILADAYGVPAVPLVHPPHQALGFDFEDYLASTGRTGRYILDSERIDIAHAEQLAQELGAAVVNLDPLLQAFPYSSR